jgi:hypothetical protein
MRKHLSLLGVGVALRPGYSGWLAALWGLMSACVVVPNPDYEDEAADETTSVNETSSSSGVREGTTTNQPVVSGTDDGSNDTSDGNAGSESSESSGAWACGDDEPDQPGPCPAECDACVGQTCIFSCSAAESCRQATLTCPPGRSCDVVCSSRQACESAVVECSPAHACAVECEGKEACSEIEVRCGAGTCTLECGGGPEICANALMRCGTNESSIQCGGQPQEVDVETDPRSTCGCAVDPSCESE